MRNRFLSGKREEESRARSFSSAFLLYLVDVLNVETHLETLLKGLHLLLFHNNLVDEIGILSELRILLSIVTTRRDIGQSTFDARAVAETDPEGFPTISAHLSSKQSHTNSRATTLLFSTCLPCRDKRNEKYCFV